jgi:hypothetical protein
MRRLAGPVAAQVAERSTVPRGHVLIFFPTQRAQREEQAAKIVKKEKTSAKKAPGRLAEPVKK